MPNASEGINRLARTVQDRIKEIAEVPQLLDFGIIQNDMSLLTDHFPRSIPQTDYFIGRSIMGRECSAVLLEDHCSIDDPCNRPIKAGDRVLVAWIGSYACVIDMIYPASSIKQ